MVISVWQLNILWLNLYMCFWALHNFSTLPQEKRGYKQLSNAVFLYFLKHKGN